MTSVQPCSAQPPPAAPSDAAVQFEEGRSVLNNNGPAMHPRAVELLRAAADAGHAVATAWLAHCHWHGVGVEKNEAEAQQLARLALDERGLQALADQGDASAQNALGAMFRDGWDPSDPAAGSQDHHKAIAWWLKAAENGNTDAQVGLACAYAEGELGMAQDDRKAVTWWQKAAEQGDAFAQWSLAIAYSRGTGVVQDDQKAVRWWRQAAKQGNLQAQVCLAEAHRDGDYGVNKDNCQAVRWWRKAAEQGHAAAQCALAEASRGGDGVRVLRSDSAHAEPSETARRHSAPTGPTEPARRRPPPLELGAAPGVSTGSPFKKSRR